MTAIYPNWRFASARSKALTPANRLSERVRSYLDQHPEISREELLLAALRREMDFRQQREGERTVKKFTAQPPPNAEDIRVHVWLSERLAALPAHRQGLWSRLRRLFFGSRLTL
jgi:hypothetical protein